MLGEWVSYIRAGSLPAQGVMVTECHCASVVPSLSLLMDYHQVRAVGASDAGLLPSQLCLFFFILSWHRIFSIMEKEHVS